MAILQLLNATGSDKEVLLELDRMVLGRHPDCDVVLLAEHAREIDLRPAIREEWVLAVPSFVLFFASAAYPSFLISAIRAGSTFL